MGVKFYDHIGGRKMFACLKCKTHLTNRRELISTRFTGSTGRAFLFKRAVNVQASKIHDRLMLTGRHFVRDITCKKCSSKVGWMYEYATDNTQRYKEGCVILERALVSELVGMDEIDDEAADAVELTDSAAS